MAARVLPVLLVLGALAADALGRERLTFVLLVAWCPRRRSRRWRCSGGSSSPGRGRGVMAMRLEAVLACSALAVRDRGRGGPLGQAPDTSTLPALAASAALAALGDLRLPDHRGASRPGESQRLRATDLDAPELERQRRGRLRARGRSAAATKKNEPTVTRHADGDDALEREPRAAASRRPGSSCSSGLAHVQRADDGEVVEEAHRRRDDADDHQPRPCPPRTRPRRRRTCRQAAGQRQAGEAEHEHPHRDAEERPLPAEAGEVVDRRPSRPARARAPRRPRTRRSTSPSTG